MREECDVQPPNSQFLTPNDLISIVLSLVGTIYANTDIVGLRLGECRKVYTNLLKVQACNLFIKVLGQAVYIDRIILAEELDLCQGLVGE